MGVHHRELVAFKRLALKTTIDFDAAARFWNRIRADRHGHWVWFGGKDGRFEFQGKSFSARRVMAAYRWPRIPGGWVVESGCGVAGCVRPACLTLMVRVWGGGLRPVSEWDVEQLEADR